MVSHCGWEGSFMCSNTVSREHGESSGQSDLHNSFGRFFQKAEDSNLNLLWLDQASSPVRWMVHLLAVILNTDPATIRNLKEGIHNSLGVPCKKPFVCGMHAWRLFSGSESQTILKIGCALHKLLIKSYFNPDTQNRIFGSQRVFS